MYIADLHIHSRYSRATSRDCTPEYLDLWARRKGIQIVGTGDFTHPAWREELEEKLTPAEEGLYVLKEEYRIRDGVTDDSEVMRPRFVITGEISSIYKKDGKVRKVHSVLLLPGLEAAQRLSRRLETIGNIHSDGRPILGLDCHDLLEIMLELCPEAVYIPAHIWTPHFSLFGAFSGFDRIEECFGDLTPHIHALETGLSSDPPMNWRLSALDRFQLVSNSDAHSPAKLGREANLLDIERSYPALAAAIQTGNGLRGTIEFYPEEGKYHYDGHRKCHLCLSPSEALKYEGKCPVCGRKLTIGVSHRVEELADREEGFMPSGAKPFESLVPLPEVIAVSTGRSAAGAKVQAQYEEMLRRLGSEFSILREVPVEDIKKASGYLISEGIRRLRTGQVQRDPGFDGEYGKIKLFEPWEIENLDGQISFFSMMGLAAQETAASLGAEREADQGNRWNEASQMKAGGAREREDERHSASALAPESPLDPHPVFKSQSASHPVPESQDAPAQQLNTFQQEAVTAASRTIAVVAGPGTGKTKTLVSRILYLLNERGVKPSEITAVTFTKKAAAEMRERLEQQLGGKRMVKQMRIGTFHSICSQMLKNQGLTFTLADRELTIDLAAETVKRFKLPCTAGQFLQQVSLIKSNMRAVTELTELIKLTELSELHKLTGQSRRIGLPEVFERQFVQAFTHYQECLEQEEALDFDDLLLKVCGMLKNEEKNQIRKQNFAFLLVDEFQDVNPLQYQLIQAWNKGGRELFVIGDPDQSIYGFRGSDARCFERLEKDWPGLLKIRLMENYRSTPAVVEGSLAVISKNPGEERTGIPRKKAGLPIRLVTEGSELSEGIFAAKEINRLIGGIDMLDAQDYAGSSRAEEPTHGGYSFADIAILYRTHRQAEVLERCLRKEGIPYVTAGRDDFLTEKSVRGTICFFRNLLEPETHMARKVCLRLLWDLPENCVSGSIFEAMQEKYRPMLAKTKPQKVLENWIQDLDLGKDKNMEQLSGMAKLYRNMTEFLDDLIFGTEGDLKRCGGKSYTSDAVTLMTLHGSKGLEFPVVLICGVKKGVIPLERKTAEEAEIRGEAEIRAGAEIREKTKLWEESGIEEERRLFYVGMTRAKEELILITSPEESEFLSDLPKPLVHRQKADQRRNADSGVQLSFFD